MNEAPEVRLEAVTKRFTSPPTLAISSLNLNVAGGSFTVVVGASGSGKTTLLRLVGGLDSPTSGAITIGERTPELARRNKEIGWMAQRSSLLPWRTVLENVQLAQTINQKTNRTVLDPDQLLDMVGLSSFSHSYPHALSGGMQQRAALARTVAIGAPVWLMDEPFSSVDELTRDSLADQLAQTWLRFHPTVLWITHHLIEAVKLADWIVVLTPGPGQVAGLLRCDLPRPRDETSATFQAILRDARSILGLAGDRQPGAMV